MKILNFNTKGILKKFKEHENVKNKLLNYFENSNEESYVRKENGELLSKISKLDWNISRDFNREWVVFLKPYLMQHFNECANFLNYNSVEIKAIWFQQYLKNEIHQWHIHGENYTGVYYLEFDKNNAKTEILDHDENKHIVDAEEGDIVIFPSFLIHQSPKLINSNKKSIISFNIEFTNIKLAPHPNAI
jgi:hypothetical protein